MSQRLHEEEVWDLGPRVWDSGSRIHGPRIGAWGLGSGV